MNTIPKHSEEKMTLRVRLFSKLVCVAVGMISSASLAVSQVPPTSVVHSSGVMPKDYFHTGAGAHYLHRAEGDIVTQTMRGNISVLMGSGANIVVLSGDRGKFLVDAGISVSEAKVKAALNTISPTPIVYVVNTHWHWDHTDGNGWMQQSGATIIAHQNTPGHSR
jgi:Metallo-beta-lactamase superfamily